MTCAEAPEPPQATRQSEVAAYLVDLWEAGEDCRGKQGAVREFFVEAEGRRWRRPLGTG